MSSENPSLETGTDTKEKVLNVAEQLFSEHGLERVSVRDITAAADVNLGAINYHFGTKDKLIAEVFERRLVPLNRERLRALDAAEQAAGDASPSVEAILEAFIRPAVVSKVSPHPGDIAFMKLLGRSLSEPRPMLEEMCKCHFAPIRERFDAALLKALPHLTRRETFWRLSFTFGALHHWLVKSPNWTPEYSADVDLEGQIQRLIGFAAAGMRAPAPSDH